MAGEADLAELLATTLELAGYRISLTGTGTGTGVDALAWIAKRRFAWSDQYDMKIQAYGWLRGHGEVAIVDGDLTERRFVAAHRTGDRVTGALAVGIPPRAIRRWPQAIASGMNWLEAVGAGGAVN